MLKLDEEARCALQDVLDGLRRTMPSYWPEHIDMKDGGAVTAALGDFHDLKCEVAECCESLRQLLDEAEDLDDE